MYAGAVAPRAVISQSQVLTVVMVRDTWTSLPGLEEDSDSFAMWQPPLFPQQPLPSRLLPSVEPPQIAERNAQKSVAAELHPILV